MRLAPNCPQPWTETRCPLALPCCSSLSFTCVFIWLHQTLCGGVGSSCQRMWDLSSLTGGIKPASPALERRLLNHHAVPSPG